MANRTVFSALVFIALSAGVAEARPVAVAVIGDSNVAGNWVADAYKYPTQLAQALQARGHDVRVHNAGISGDTTARVLARLDQAVPPGTQVAVVWVGINDLRRGAPEARVRAGQQAIASRLRARGIKVHLITAPAYDFRFHSDPALRVFDGHLNGAGYAKMVGRTLKPIESLVIAAKKRG